MPQNPVWVGRESVARIANFGRAGWFLPRMVVRMDAFHTDSDPKRANAAPPHSTKVAHSATRSLDQSAREALVSAAPDL